jgi:hypothetical protein
MAATQSKQQHRMKCTRAAAALVLITCGYLLASLNGEQKSKSIAIAKAVSSLQQLGARPLSECVFGWHSSEAKMCGKVE